MGFAFTFAAVAEPQFHLTDLMKLAVGLAGWAWVIGAGTAAFAGVIAFLYSLKYGWAIFGMAVLLELPLVITIVVASASEEHERQAFEVQCRASSGCHQIGLCSAAPTSEAPDSPLSCQALADADCKASAACGTEGKCVAENKVCTWATQRDGTPAAVPSAPKPAAGGEHREK